MSHNPAIGRFLSVDPLTKSYPELTPYQFASNRPIDGIDLDGLEYDDSKLRIIRRTGTNVLQVEGQIDVKVKIINLSSQSKIPSDVQKFHELKSSNTFDIESAFTISTVIPIDPITGEKNIPAKKYRVEAKKIDINFEFIGVYNSLSELDKGDVALLLVDEIPGADKKGDSVGRSELGGVVYAVESKYFLDKSHTDTHEKGHLIGGMMDWKAEDGAKKGYLMSYVDDGSGYNLRLADRRNLIIEILDRKGLNVSDNMDENTDTKKRAEDFIKKNNIDD